VRQEPSSTTPEPSTSTQTIPSAPAEGPEPGHFVPGNPELLQLAPEQPVRIRKVPIKPGNVYGDKHPMEVEKAIRRPNDWKKIVGESGHPRRTAPTPVVDKGKAPERTTSPVDPFDLPDWGQGHLETGGNISGTL